MGWGEKHVPIVAPKQPIRDTVVAWISGGNVSAGFFDSSIKLLQHDNEHEQRILAFQGTIGPYIATNRNEIIQFCLDNYPDMEYLFFLDIDMVFQRSILDTIFKAYERANDTPVISALYFNRYAQYQKQWLPTWLEFRGDNTFIVESFNLGMLHNLAAVGMGCTLIPRKVLEDVEKLAPPHDPWIWFGHDLVQLGGEWKRAGEDVTFCKRVREAGHQILGLGVPVAQTKECNIGIDTYETQRLI